MSGRSRSLAALIVAALGLSPVAGCSVQDNVGGPTDPVRTTATGDVPRPPAGTPDAGAPGAESSPR